MGSVDACGQGGASQLPFFCGNITLRELRVVPTQPESITVHTKAAEGVLAPRRTFTAVPAKLSAILGETPIEGPAGVHLWLLDMLPGDLTASQPTSKDLKLHPRHLLCEPDASDEAEVRFMKGHDAGLFEVLGVLGDKDLGSRQFVGT